jgi:hypothetical protein
MCLASPSGRPVFLGNFVANFVGECRVGNDSDKGSDKGNASEGGAKQIRSRAVGGGMQNPLAYSDDSSI